MYLDPGTLFAITIALAGSCFVMVVGLRRATELERVIRIKNKRIIELEGQINSRSRKERV